MDNYYQKYLSNVEWLFVEDKFDPKLQAVNESLFTLGNGYIGSRGSYEEYMPDGLPGTFFAGIFNESALRVAEIINAPNPYRFSINVKDETLNLSNTHYDYHQRILDLKRGVLTRHTIFENSQAGLIDYQSIRFVSNFHLNIAVMQIVITPLNQSTFFTVDCSFDRSIKNNVQNYKLFHAEKINYIDFFSVESLDHKKEIAFGQKIFLEINGKIHAMNHSMFDFQLEKNQKATITKIISFHCTKDDSSRKNLKKSIVDTLDPISQLSFEVLLNQHISAFEERWKNYDIEIVGDTDVQALLRLNIYHSIIAMHKNLTDVSLGAKLLTGEGYKGHVFWESELLMVPIYLAAEPRLARSLLEYRYNRLSLAKKIAEDRGFQGALFPWESADSGLDETPSWTEDLDKTVKVVHTGKQSLHINVAIFYALYNYFCATQDIEFMLTMGLSMSIEMARFWKSRVVYSKKLDAYRIKKVMGPDEFHEMVNDNAYTNKLVSWSLDKTLDLIKRFEREYPEQTKLILKNHKFNFREMLKIKNIAEKIWFPTQEKIILQFDNFLKLKNRKMPALDVLGLPALPSDFLVIDLYKTQFVKQADVVLLLLLLPSYFDKKTIEANFHFYDIRTLHKSSWSPPIYSAVAAQLNFSERAYHYFNLTLNTDKKNIFGNSNEGMHTPAIGGAWLSLMYGFCGVRIFEDRLCIEPCLPALWQSVKVKTFYLGFIVNLKITQDQITIRLESANCLWLTSQPLRKESSAIIVQVYQQVIELKPNKDYTIIYKA